MPIRFLSILLALLVVASTSGSAGEQPAVRTCRGLSIASFEGRFPGPVRHFDFDRRMLNPFLRMWRAKRRPDLPAVPQWVRVYAIPERPYLVGFHRDGCVIALFTVGRSALWRWLRPELGWPA